jgi:hypothetical protein
METNLEHATTSKEEYVFFNSKALNFEEVQSQASLVNLAKEGAIVIENITLGG